MLPFFVSCFVLGMVASFTSLMATSLFDLFLDSEKMLALYLFVLTEETLKLIALIFLFDYGFSSSGFSLLKTTFAGISLGAGFALFETVLIFLSNGKVPLEATAPAAIHLITSIFLALGLNSLLAKKTTPPFKSNFLAYSKIGFAVMLHLCYNIFVLIGT